MRFSSILIGLFLLASPARSISQMQHQDLLSFCDSLFNVGINDELIPGGIITVVTSDSIIMSKGYGYADIQSKTKVDPFNTLFQLGSVGKVFTSIAILQQIDQGKIDLNQNVNTYLSDWTIDNPFDSSITPIHLLTHSAGFNEKLVGYMAKSNADLGPLGDHLKKNMPSTFQPPGININYSNYSYALAGHLTEVSSGIAFKSYIQERIFNPIGMDRSTYLLPDNYKDEEKYALGYETREKFYEVTNYPKHATPAGSILSTGMDMGKFLQQLLKKDSSILSPSGYELLFNQQFSNHPVLPGYTCGMEVYRFGNEEVVGKAGNVPGFLSAMILFKERGLALFLSVNTETDNFFELFFKEFKNEFFSETIPQWIPDRNVNSKEYVGNYGNMRTSRNTIEEMFLLFMGHFRIYEGEQGILKCYHSGGWQSYGSKDKDVFQNLEHPSQFLIFERDSEEKIKHLYRSEMVGGLEVPVSYRKLSWLERPRFINDEYPFVLVFLLTYLILPIFWMIVWLVNSYTSLKIKYRKLLPLYHVSALTFIGLFMWSVIGFFIPFIRNRESLLFGLPPEMLNMKYVHYAMALVSIGLIILSGFIWKRKDGNLFIRVYFTLFSLAALSYILVLHRWHFLTIST